ncbi:MAG: outer membrane protein assembly factor BamD [bacterium]
MRHSVTIRLFVACLFIVLATGCAGNKPKEDLVKLEQETAQKLYASGQKELKRKNYQLAIKNFETLTTRYPFTDEAQNAQLDIATAYYKMAEPDTAIATADDFIKTNPRHKRVDYAYYLKGLVNSRRYDSFLDKYIVKDIANLDTTALETAFEDFKRLIRRYPDSEYVDEARQRMIFLRNALARHELNVADYYMRRGAWVAAANRCQYLITKYDRADSVPEALQMMVEAYENLGDKPAQQEAQAVLEKNFPSLAKKRKGFFGS